MKSLVLVALAMAELLLGQQVAPMSMTDTSGVSRTASPIAPFSRIFADGDICSYPKPLVNGFPVPLWQANVKTRWQPSGCVKQAIFTLHSDLATNATASITFENSTSTCHLGNQVTCDAAGLSESAILAAKGGTWNATTQLTSTVDGSVQSVDARTMVAAHKWTYWIRGPVATQIIVRDADPSSPYNMGFATTAAAPLTLVKGLMPWYVITVFSNYSAGVGLQFMLENTWTSMAINQVYSIALKNGAGTNVYAKSNVTHYYAGRFHKGNPASPIWDGTAIGTVRFDHNFAYLAGAKAFPNYDTTLIPNAAAIVSSYNTSDLGDDFGDAARVYTNLGGTGARSDISWTHAHQNHCVKNPAPGCDAVIFTGTGDVAGHLPIHFREADAGRLLCATACTGPNALVSAFGRPINFQSRSGFNSNSITDINGTVASSLAGDRIPLLGTITKGVWTWETGHHPSMAYVPYILSGDYYYYEEMEFWAGVLSTSSTPVGRGWEWGLQVHINNQMRGAAWSLRTVSQYAFAALDGSPEREMYMTNLNWNAEYQQGLLGETGGNFPRANFNCPGYVAGQTGPTSGPDRDRGCFGYQYVNRAKPNPLHSAPWYQTVDWNSDGWGRFDYKLTSTQQYAPWMMGYMLICLNWIDDAVTPAFSKVLEDYLTYYANSRAYPRLSSLLLGGTYAYWHPSHDPNQNFFQTFADYEAAVRLPAITTTLTGSITSTDGVMTVANPAAAAFRPSWRRCVAVCSPAGTSNSITNVSASANVVTVTFNLPPGLSIGDRILSAGHSLAALNVGGVSRYVTAVTSNSISFLANGTVADGTSYAEAGYFVQTPRTNLLLKVGTEYINICGVETNGLISIDSDGNTNGSASMVANTSTWCTPNVRGRGQVGTTKVAHSAGETVESGWDAWADGNNPSGGYTWIMNAAFAGVTKYAGGTAAWQAHQSNVISRFTSYYNSAKDLTWSIRPRTLSSFYISTGGLNSGTVGAAYYQRIFTAGQTGAVTWSYTGTLPAGLGFNASTGEISGTPSAAQSTSITVTASDAGTSPVSTTSATFGITVQSPSVTITITPLSLNPATQGTAYSQTFTANGGTSPYIWSRASGSFPSGVSLVGAVLSGTPAQCGSFSFTIRATDSLANPKDQAYTLEVACLPLVITSTVLPDGTVGNAYTFQLTYTGGTGSNTWTVSGGVYPPGLDSTALQTGGVVSGTPSSSQDYAFTVRVQDSAGSTATKAFTLRILPPPQGYTFQFKNLQISGVKVN